MVVFVSKFFLRLHANCLKEKLISYIQATKCRFRSHVNVQVSEEVIRVVKLYNDFFLPDLPADLIN
jgi:hypothetical protein